MCVTREGIMCVSQEMDGVCVCDKGRDGVCGVCV